MFIYMRALKCHPAIEQSGQPKGMRRRVIQLWSRMVKGPWHTSYLSYFTLTHFDGQINRWPTRSDIEQCNITEMESSEVMPCITKPKTQVPSQADAGLGGQNKNMCSQRMKYVFFFSIYPIKYQQDMSCGRP